MKRLASLLRDRAHVSVTQLRGGAGQSIEHRLEIEDRTTYCFEYLDSSLL
jgi:hypothetical protein